MTQILPVLITICLQHLAQSHLLIHFSQGINAQDSELSNAYTPTHDIREELHIFLLTHAHLPPSPSQVEKARLHLVNWDH